MNAPVKHRATLLLADRAFQRRTSLSDTMIFAVLQPHVDSAGELALIKGPA